MLTVVIGPKSFWVVSLFHNRNKHCALISIFDSMDQILSNCPCSYLRFFTLACPKCENNLCCTWWPSFYRWFSKWRLRFSPYNDYYTLLSTQVPQRRRSSPQIKLMSWFFNKFYSQLSQGDSCYLQTTLPRLSVVYLVIHCKITFDIWIFA